MILKNDYPICEFDTSKKTIIIPSGFLTESLPEKCVITFFERNWNNSRVKTSSLLSVISVQKCSIYLFMNIPMARIGFALRWHSAVLPARP